MKLDNKRLRFVLLGLVGVAIVLFIIILIGGLSLLSAKSNQVVNQKLESEKLEAQLSSLGVAKYEVDKYSYFTDVAKTVIPNDKDQAQAVLDIFKMADESGISIQNVTFPDSNLGAPGSTSSGGTSASGASAKTALSQAKAVDGIPGLYSVELTITPESSPELPVSKQITYGKLIDFLQKLENNRRTAQITSVIVQPQGNEDGPSPYINFTLKVNIFIKP
jgi:type II secretory pathway pseudopilin PulG